MLHSLRISAPLSLFHTRLNSNRGGRFAAVIAIFCALIFAGAGRADGLGQAVIAGIVQDSTGDAIPGVTVTVTPAAREGTAREPSVAWTGMDGSFSVTGLAPGGYQVNAVLDGFQPIDRELKLGAGQKIQMQFKLVPAMSATVEVVAEAEPAGEVAILESRRQAPVVSDVISSEEIRKTPDSNAASVVERLTGVTLMNNKFVFIRGLGERYSGTTINGAAVPTTETEKRVVPLDLFPAKLLDTVNVVKTYTPDKPGDFGAGTVEMTTTDFPGSQTFKLTMGSGYQSGSTGASFRQYAGGLGTFGRGGQPLPASFPRQYIRKKSVLNSDGFTAAELEAFGEALVGDWTGETVSSAPPATDFSLTWGDTIGRLGVVVSAVSNHKYGTTDEVQTFYGLDLGDRLTVLNDYDMTTDHESANTGLVGNFAYRLTDDNRLFLNSVYTRDAGTDNRYQAGLSATTGGLIRDYRVKYQIEQIRSNRLRGEHNLAGPGLGSLIEWNLAQSKATNDSNIRENLYRESSPGHYTLQVGYSSSGEADFYSLNDRIGQGGASWTTFYTAHDGAWSGSVKGGIDSFRRTREFGARRFAFTTPNQNQFDLSQRPEEIFTPENIRPGGLELREVTGLNDAYDATHTIHAGYLMADSSFGRWRVIGGARYEDSDEQVNTFNPFDTSNPVNSIDQEKDLLPSLNLVYQSSSTTNFRFAYGRTVNRPEFRELSPFAFIEIAAGRSVAGNPNLTEATLDSYDLRWETFPAPGQVIAASIFYKVIDQPIERVVQPTSDLRTTFVNADSARLHGLELELRRSLDVLSPSLQNWSLNANYSRISSTVTVGAGALAASTNSERPLQGQSDQVANLALQYFRSPSGSLVRLLGSYIGRRLTDVGAFGLPDIYEEPFTSLDAVISQRISRAAGLELKLAASNLLDERHEFTQGGELQRRFDPGRSLSLSLSYTRSRSAIGCRGPVDPGPGGEIVLTNSKKGENMRKILTFIVVALVAGQALAAGTAHRGRAVHPDRTSWIKRAVFADADAMVSEASAALTDAAGARPIVLLETNYYTFNPGDPLELRMSIYNNGFTAPATLYLYRENRETGERSYYNVGSGMLSDGEISDLFGTPGSPVPVFVPTVEDFVLFGSSSDDADLGWAIDGALGASFTVPASQTGMYQWILEIRDGFGKRIISSSNAMYSYIDGTVEVSGNITTNTTWTNDKRYILHQFVGVVAPAVLTIEPGTVIYGGDGQATLFIQRGAKIMADGTARRPIVFTSPLRVGDRAQRDWGSLVLLGKAPINDVGGESFFEGLPNEAAYQFGGTDAHDSSGVLRYVRLEFGGFPIAPDQEINGLSNAGIGDGTTEDYIQVLQNKDDCVEFFGGTVNVKHFLGVGCADDGLDFDLGYQGNIQYFASIHRSINDENDSNLVTESDNHPKDFTLTPFTQPHVYNVTGFRPPAANGHYGAVLRRGTGYDMHNAIVIGSKKAPVTIRDDATWAHEGDDDLVWNHSILFGDFSDAGGYPDGTQDPARIRTFLFTTMNANRNVDPLLAIGPPASDTQTLMPDLSPMAGSPALDVNYVGHPPDNGFFDQVDFIGAVGPNDNWILSGWANFSDN